jgi:molybdopterin-binding protein
VSEAIDRGELLSGGARGAAGLLLAGSAFGLAPAVARADTPSDNDLAYARLLVTIELLALDFYSAAISSRHFHGAALTGLRRARADEAKHRDAAAAVLTSAGQVPPLADDVDFSYPRGSFATRASIARLGARLESLFLGAYLGAVEGYEANALRHLRSTGFPTPWTGSRASEEEAVARQYYTASDAAHRLGISLDTLRRWDRSGRIKTTRDSGNRRLVAAKEIERLRGRQGGDQLSARNRLPGTVSEVKVDGLIAQVELVVTDPVRIVAIVTADAVEELGLREGEPATAVVKATSVMVEHA